MQMPNPSPSYSVSITAESNRKWLRQHTLEVKEYLLLNHKREDWRTVFDLLYWSFPDEGRKLVENYNLSEDEKKEMFIEFIYNSPQITCLIFGDERMGKDGSLNKFYEDVNKWCEKKKLKKPRVVTLGNIKNPPFVDESDMYFSFRDLPSGKGDEQVWVYCSELDAMLPARDTQGPENKTFSLLSGTFAQNHLKLFGCVKLASKVDLNAIRGCNAKLFKYINPEKLQIGNVERANVLSPLGGWLLPSDRNNKRQALLAFDNQLFTVNYDLPEWWTQDYSEQFNNIPDKKVWDFIDSICLDMKPTAVMDVIAQKFRNKTITLKMITDHFKELGIKV